MATAKSGDEHLNNVLHKFEGATKHPERYISCQPAHEASVTACTQTLFNIAASHAEENINFSNPLTELITEGFDDEQIWQELELQNRPCVGTVVGCVARLVASRGRLCLQELAMQKMAVDNEGEEEEGDSDSDDEEEEMEDVLLEEESKDGNNDRADAGRTRTTISKRKGVARDSEESDEESDTNFDIDDLHSRTQQKKKPSSKSSHNKDKQEKGKSSAVDDQFFKLEDMEKFLEMEDAKEAKRVRQMDKGDVNDEEGDDEHDDDESLDYFDDASSDDEGFDDEDDDDNKHQIRHSKKSTRQWMYNDFFDDPGNETAKPKKKKKVHFDEEGDEEDMEEGSEKDFEEESFEDADEDLLADLRKSAGASNKDDLLLSGSESEGEEIGDILGGSKKKKTKDQSSFEKRQEKLRHRIDELEQSNLAQKSWQLIGEVGGAKRPENSILEESLEFDVTTRPAPVITEETTQTLEGMIRQRVLDQAWDDVQRKAKPKEEATEFKKRVTLDQEKSKLSLGEIYEQEYIKQTQQEVEEKEDPLHTEVKESMDALFIKLDALSNFHFTPKPIAPEVRIVSNTPAITMEEVTPINVADSTLLAPEEIQEKEKGELKGKTEKTGTDRMRDLRKKKQRQRAKARDREKREKMVEKLNPGLGNKYSKKAALAKLEKSSKAPSSNTTIVKDASNKGTLKSSKAFFSKLQDEVVAEVHGFKKKKKQKQMSGTQLKL